MLASLQRYYQGRGHLRRHVVPILDTRGPVSLRLLDWLVTNYAKQRNVYYAHGGKPFSMYRHYRLQLQAYTKRLFDPFQRRARVVFSDGDKTITTTIGQLNFFKWAIEHGVLDYAERHVVDIEAHMQAQPKPVPHQRKAVTAFNDPCSSLSGNFVV